MELLRRRTVVMALRTKTMQGGCHGTWFIALAPRNSPADHTADLGVWRPARLIAAKRSALPQAILAEARLEPGLSYSAFGCSVSGTAECSLRY